MSLAGRVIASHYAEPLKRRLTAPAPLLAEASKDADVLAALTEGDVIDMLDSSRGWAWGYAGPDGLVGYVRAEAVQ